MEKLKNLIPGQKINEAKITAKQLRGDLSDYLNKNSEKIAKEFIPKGTPYFIKKNNDGISFMIGGNARTTSLGNIKSETQDYVKIDINLAQATGAVTSANYFDKATIAEAMDDLEAPLPSQLTRFLQKTISIIKGYNLSRKKEALVMAKVIDAMGIDKSDLNQIMSRVRKAGVLNKENKEQLEEYDKTYFASPEFTEKIIDDAVKEAKKKLKKFGEKGFLSKSEYGQVVTKLYNVGFTVNGDGEKGLRKKFENKEGSINEGSVASYFTQWDSPTKSAAKKVDDALGKLIKDKKELSKLADLITDLADEYAQERIDAYQQDMIDRY